MLILYEKSNLNSVGEITIEFNLGCLISMQLFASTSLQQIITTLHYALIQSNFVKWNHPLCAKYIQAEHFYCSFGAVDIELANTSAYSLLYQAALKVF